MKKLHNLEFKKKGGNLTFITMVCMVTQIVRIISISQYTAQSESFLIPQSWHEESYDDKLKHPISVVLDVMMSASMFIAMIELKSS